MDPDISWRNVLYYLLFCQNHLLHFLGLFSCKMCEDTLFSIRISMLKIVLEPMHENISDPFNEDQGDRNP